MHMAHAKIPKILGWKVYSTIFRSVAATLNPGAVFAKGGNFHVNSMIYDNNSNIPDVLATVSDARLDS